MIEAQKYLVANPEENCRKAQHIYLDINLSLRSIPDNLQTVPVDFEDLTNVSIRIAGCFLLMVRFNPVFT
jgi:hypothetical protein